MSRSGRIAFTILCVIGATSAALAAVLLWLLITQPFRLVQFVAGLPVG